MGVLSAVLDKTGGILRYGRVLEKKLFLIAGSGRYPELVAEAAKRAGVEHVAMVAFEGETDLATAAFADELTWMRVGSSENFSMRPGNPARPPRSWRGRSRRRIFST